MNFLFDEKQPDSSFIDTIWRTESESAGTFTSCAVSNWEMVITKQRGRVSVCVRGPETKATPAPCPENAEFFGIMFKLGTFLPYLPAHLLLDGGVVLPEAAGKSFCFSGSTWQIPEYENAETFVDRLVRAGLLLRETIVEDALQGRQNELSLRSVQRRFLRATGLTIGAVRQIERARKAEALLEQGVSILDTVDQTGYADQPHLTRSLKRLVGRTPAQILGSTLSA